ncbi:alpha/beta hydrolase [Natronincola peptidivorans]|uniref:alpha/beta hydrolase n=1 Tax=Natronincola peptidivorans TaxID=426128 RepID=UPI00147D87E9|nr:alpha/beta fold hydrolase [Natronincola peptidivorans]
MAIYLILIYIVVLIALFVFQESFIYFPQKITRDYSEELIKESSNVEEIIINSYDETLLHGWLVKNKEVEKSPLIIYYGGNAEEVSHMVRNWDHFSGYSLLLVNYRGYGLSEGRPKEKHLHKDAVVIFDEMIKREDIDKENIVVMGRSIGTGVAVAIAEKKDIHGVILITPFDSLIKVVQNKMRIIPADWILRNRFDSIEKAPNIKQPLLVLAAKDDKVIPSQHATNLAEKWGGEVDIEILDGVVHNTIQYHSLYWDSIKKFLERIQ